MGTSVLLHVNAEKRENALRVAQIPDDSTWPLWVLVRKRGRGKDSDSFGELRTGKYIHDIDGPVRSQGNSNSCKLLLGAPRGGRIAGDVET